MRRLGLILFVLVAPAALTWLMYRGSVFVLAATSRTIDPEVLNYAAVIEFVVFTWVAILEARARWSIPS
ncbi:MAG: hypothetical protein HY243_11610 [Proteobacteria bacterium]|nr:hypothetical protein [Pseudomonadota bacterium]